jgi:hypothetical protein
MQRFNVPYFIIVGSMKSGTTSLHHFLMEQDEVFMKRGEAHFFDRPKELVKGIERYYKMLGLPKDFQFDKKVGDDTPTYSYKTSVPKNIHQLCPDVKILWILRDPIKRSISQYWHAVRSGSEMRDINHAFNAELNQRTKNIWHKYMYRSQYLWQIQNYLEVFDKKQICFVDFERFVANNPEEIQKITNFLDIRITKPGIPHSNETPCYPRPFVNRLLKLIPDSIKNSKTLKRSVRQYFAYQKSNLPQLADETKLRLKAVFDKDKEELYKLTQLEMFK